MGNFVVGKLVGGAAAADEQEIGEPFFERLPDELIASQILDRVSDAKSLCRCSLLSKRFSALVYLTKTLTIKIPLDIPHPKPRTATQLYVFPGKIVHVAAHPTVWVQQLSSASITSTERFIPTLTKFDLDLLDSIPKFVGKFACLESLLVELDYSASYDLLDFRWGKAPAVKWMLDYSRSRSFVTLMAPISVDEDDNAYSLEFESHNLVLDCHLAIYLCSDLLMATLPPYFPEPLVKFVITDSKRRGWIEFGERDIFWMRPRNRSLLKMEERKYLLRLWHESRYLQVPPLSEFARAASRTSIRHLFLGKDNGDFDNDYSRVEEAFQGVGMIYIEAVMEMLMQIRAA